MHVVLQEFTQVAPFASIVIAAVDRALFDQRYLANQWAGLDGEVGEEWHNCFDVSAETECMSSIEQVCSLLVNLAIYTHDRGVYFGIGDEAVGSWTALPHEILSEDSIACSERLRSPLVFIWGSIPNFESLLVLIVEEEVVYYKAYLAGHAHEIG